ncbi:ribokinase [uncultured Tateyamaria sp.]|uniref:ribokinase n=1 Tax=uncultured Tateyamaria sp. TaxID=455651 RepID=UPI0026355CAB|nr:ribokinase [uncultured Tateyamaria sp.]
MTDVFVAGSLHWDIVVDAPRLPGLDETLMGHSVAYRFGGKGGNQAVAAARMGASVAMAGLVGRDDAGRRLRAMMDASGVDHTQVFESDQPSGMSVAIVDENGEYGAVVVSGANMRLVADNIVLPPNLKVLLLQNEVPESVNLALAKRSRDTARVILNAAPARALPGDLLSCIDVLVVNRVEATALIGAEDGPLDAEAAARAICAMGPMSAVVTLGAEGLVVADASGAERLSAFSVDTVSSHGAGDMFCGALAAEIAKGATVREACRFGAAAAALAVSTPFAARDSITERAVRRLMG